MPFNGSGVFNKIYSWVADKNAGIDITASRFDTQESDFTSSGFDNCLTRDGQGVATADLPMNTFRHTGVGDGVARTDYASLGQAQDSGVQWGGTSAGSAGNWTITLTPPITAYVSGQTFRWIAGNDAVGSDTFNINGVGVRGAFFASPGGVALPSADAWIAGQIIEATYNAVYGGFQVKLVYAAAFPTVVDSIASSGANSGLTFSASTGNVGALFSPNSIAGKASPTASDAVVIADVAASGVAKLSTVQQIFVGFIEPNSASMGGNVAISSPGTWFDGPALGVGSGAWFASGNVTLLVNGGGSGGDFGIVLWDDSDTQIASTRVNIQPNAYVDVHLSGLIANPNAHIRISVNAASVTTGVIIASNSFGTSRDSTLTVFRLA